MFGWPAIEYTLTVAGSDPVYVAGWPGAATPQTFVRLGPGSHTAKLAGTPWMMYCTAIAIDEFERSKELMYYVSL